MLQLVVVVVLLVAAPSAGVVHTTSLRLPTPFNDTILAVCGTNADTVDRWPTAKVSSYVLVLSQTRFMAFESHVGDCDLKLVTSLPVLGCENAGTTISMLRVRHAFCECGFGGYPLSPRCTIFATLSPDKDGLGRALTFTYGFPALTTSCAQFANFTGPNMTTNNGTALFSFKSGIPDFETGHDDYTNGVLYAFAIRSQLDLHIGQADFMGGPLGSVLLNVPTQTPR